MLPIPGALNLQPGLHIFTVHNDGLGDLEITNPVFLGGSDHFSLDQAPSSLTITPGSSVTFTIRFAPIEIGTHLATIVIQTNDKGLGDDSTFTFDVQGVGTRVAARIRLNGHDAGAAAGATNQIGTARISLNGYQATGRTELQAEQVGTARINLNGHDAAVLVTPFQPFWITAGQSILID